MFTQKLSLSLSLSKEGKSQISNGNPPLEELLRKIQELKVGQAELRQHMSKLKLSSDAKSEQQQAHHKRTHFVSPQSSAWTTFVLRIKKRWRRPIGQASIGHLRKSPEGLMGPKPR